MAGHCTQLIVARRHGRRPTATHLWFPQGTTNPRSYHRHPFNAHIALAMPSVSHKNLVVVGGVSTRRTTTIPTHAHTHTQDCPYSPFILCFHHGGRRFSRRARLRHRERRCRRLRHHSYGSWPNQEGRVSYRSDAVENDGRHWWEGWWSFVRPTGSTLSYSTG